MDKHVCIYLIILVTVTSHTCAQFKVVDSSQFRTKKGVVSSSSSNSISNNNNATNNIAYVQINHYSRPPGLGESRGFSNSRAPFPVGLPSLKATESGFIKVLLMHNSIDQRQNVQALATAEEAVQTNRIEEEPSSKSRLLQAISNNKNLNKYNPKRILPRNRRRLMGKRNSETDHLSQIHLENQKILTKLKIPRRKQATNSKYGTYISNCRCEKLSNCPRIQISVPRCKTDYYMCCFP